VHKNLGAPANYTTLQVIKKETTMASSEGSREIEAARLRLAAAKSRVSSDTKALQTANESKKSVEEMVAKMLENATNSVNAAQNQLSISEKEVKEAQSMLAAAEKRWEVISIDLDSDNEEAANTKQGQDSNKKRKVSLSPQSNNNTNSTRNNNATLSTGQFNTTVSATSNSAAATRPTNNNNNLRAASSINARNTSTSNNNNVLQFIVEGCGMPTVNGTYTLDKKMYKGSVMYTKPEKESNSPLDTDRIGILKSWIDGQPKWYIVFLSSGERVTSYLYVSEENANRMDPPEDGWKTMGRGWGVRVGIGPAPTCRLLQNGNSIGNSNVSGTSLSARGASAVAAGHQSNTNNGQLDTGLGLHTNGSSNRASVSSTTLDTTIITSDTAASFPKVVDQIVIKNCGDSEINGMYTRVGDLQGAPVYTKGGKEPNTLNCYAILRCRRAGGGWMNWYIGNWGAQADGNISFNIRHASCTNGEVLFPPETMWYRQRSDGTRDWSIFSLTCRLILPNDHIAIEGCGNVELNGTYSRDFRNTNEREYKRQGKWNGKVVNFSIYRNMDGSNYKWFIGRSANATSSSTSSHLALFRSAENNDLFPPSTGWEVIGTIRGGLYPSPTFRAVEIKQVTVEGCGLSKFNGVYNRVGDNPQYVKYGQCDGDPEAHMIVRIDQAWHIGKPGDIGGNYIAHVDESDDHPKIPPKDPTCWSAIGKGVYPVPKLSWM